MNANQDLLPVEPVKVSPLRRSFNALEAGLRRRRLKWPAIVLGSVLLFVAVLGFLIAPPVLRPIVEREASAALGRTVELGGLRLNPFSLSVSLHDLRVTEADGKEDFLRADEVYANLEASSLFRGAPVLREIRLGKPRVRLVREAAGRFNFSDIIDRFSKPDEQKTDTEPARFALYNIRVQDGDIRFEDKLEGQTHRIESLQIGLPFLSNLPDKIDVDVTPELRAVVNGGVFALQGEVKPFADRREADLHLKLDDLDLLRYLDYVPGTLPVLLKQGALGVDMRLLWSEAKEGAAALSVEGSLNLSKLVLETPQKKPLLQLGSLHVQIAKLEPLAQPLRGQIAKIELVAPQLSLSRDKDGRLSIASADKPAQAPEKAPAKSAPPQIVIGELSLRDGGVSWRDEAVPGGFSGGFNSIALNLKGFDLAGKSVAPLTVDIQSEGRGAFGVQGTLRGIEEMDLQAQIKSLPLGRYLPYLRQVLLQGDLDGTLDAHSHIVLRQGEGSLQYKLDQTGFELSGIRLTDPDERTPFLQVAKLQLADLSVDPDAQQVKLGSVRTEGGNFKLVRDPKGRFRLVRLLFKEEAREAVKEAASEVKKREWGFIVGEGALSGWEIALEDQGVNPPVRMNLRGVKLGVSGLSNLDRSLGKVQLSSAVNAKGAIQVDGQVGLGPLRGDLGVDLRGVDVLIAQPYVDDMWRILITRGQLFAKGRTQFETRVDGPPALSYRGELALREFNSLDTLNDTDFLRWKDFGIKGLDFQLKPLKVLAKEVTLDAFYTRLILDAQGRFNLRELRMRDEAPAAAPVVQPKPGTAVAQVGPPPAPDMTLGVDRIVFRDGDINYSDRFIKPNYDAHLLRVKGSIEGIGTDQSKLARIDMQAALDGNAPVSVKGETNPFRRDGYLDLNAQVSDVDLTSVSAYSTKYVGYGITRGKLSMKLDYKIRDRVLTAQNQIFLDQLTFGDKVEAPGAPDLPIKLGVALLKDSKGRIDVNLPVSGSLDDPQFSVAGVIWRAIGNLFTKIVTSPFSLLGSMFDGDEDALSYIDFDPGKSQLSAANQEKLKALSVSLISHPGLSLDITGHADPAADVAGLKQERLEGRLRALKAERLVRKGESVEAVDALRIEPAERGELLWEIYKREPFEKPRNAIGLVRELPPAELEQALLKNSQISEEALRALATRRANAVRDWLVTTGQVPSERVFLLSATHEDKAKLAPRVEFALR